MGEELAKSETKIEIKNEIIQQLVHAEGQISHHRQNMLEDNAACDGAIDLIMKTREEDQKRHERSIAYYEGRRDELIEKLHVILVQEEGLPGSEEVPI